MVRPPRTRFLPLLMALVGLLAWVYAGPKPESASDTPFNPSLQISIAGDSSHPAASVTAYPALLSRPDTLPAPIYEEPSSVPAWAQPVAPEGAFNIELTSEGRPWLYMVTYPEVGRTGLYGVPVGSNEPVLLTSIATNQEALELHPIADEMRVLYHYSMGGSPGLFSVAITGTERITLTRMPFGTSP